MGYEIGYGRGEGDFSWRSTLAAGLGVVVLVGSLCLWASEHAKRKAATPEPQGQVVLLTPEGKLTLGKFVGVPVRQANLVTWKDPKGATRWTTAAVIFEEEPVRGR